MSHILHFQAILQIDLTWLFDLYLWPLTSWLCEGSYVMSINHVWFQSDFNFSNEVNFTFWAHLTTWPDGLWTWYMTSDHKNIQRVPYCINTPSLVPIGLKLFKQGHFYNFSLSYNLTSDNLWHWYVDLWPHQQMRVLMLHLWPNFGWNQSKHVDSRAKFMLTCFHDNSQQGAKWSLRVFPAKAGDTKIMYQVWSKKSFGKYTFADSALKACVKNIIDLCNKLTLWDLCSLCTQHRTQSVLWWSCHGSCLFPQP